MASSATAYVAREPDEQGYIHYPDEENETWQILMSRQMQLLPGRACQEYFDGLDQLQLPVDRVPQLEELNRVLARTTGWRVERVPALISFDRFFKLLSEKCFPVATFIRTREELDYLREPDIFHEIFGHCPLLTNPDFATFTHTYGKLAYKANKEDRIFLARLYWMTVEFGLVDTADGLRIYGGGILSSPKETVYSLESDKPLREAFDPVAAMRTPYRIDILQSVYFVIKQMSVLQQLSDMDIMAMVSKAKTLGLFEPRYPPKDEQ